MEGEKSFCNSRCWCNRCWLVDVSLVVDDVVNVGMICV